MKLEDGATRIFINTRGTNRQEFSQEFLDFMEYITATTDEIADGTKSHRIKLIHEKVRKIKISEKMGVKFMQKWEEIAYARDEGLAQGQAKGEKLNMIRLVCKKLRKGKTPEEISEDLEEDMEVILRICNAANEYAPDYDAEAIYTKLFE